MTKQPVLTGFPHTIFATAKRRAQAAIQALRKSLISDSLSGYALIFESVLPPAFLSKIDPTNRDRHFGHLPVFWAWFAQILEGNASCTKGLSMIQSWCRVLKLPVPASDTSGYCKARTRINDSFLDQIDEQVKQVLEKRIQPRDSWRGHTLKAIDGTSVTLMDTLENQISYPQHTNAKEGCGFPIMGILGMVNGEFLFGPTEKEAFRRMMWRMSEFSGVEILTYVVMDNHFHVLAKVPDREKWLRKFEGEEGEERLLKHLATVYSKKFLEQLRREISTFKEQGNERAVGELLERFKKRFCDISLFVKELKERFSRWFNKQQGRRGTLWMDRFKSVLVDGETALAMMAAYIDLTPIRAGIEEDPMLYEWSGYGEAAGGSRRARRGLCKALSLPQGSWEGRGLARYRLFLYDEGLLGEPESESLGKGRKRREGIKLEARTKVVEQRGEVNPGQNLRKRVVSFSTGVAIGGEDFVKGMAARYREVFDRKNARSPRPMTGGDGGFFVMRD